MVQILVVYFGEEEPASFDIPVENGKLRLSTVLDRTELVFGVDVHTKRIISTDLEGNISGLDLTVDPVAIEGLRQLRSMTIKNILERPSGSGYAIFEGRFTSVGTTEVNRFPSRVVRFQIGPLVRQWFEELQDSTPLGISTFGPYMYDVRKCQRPYLSETTSNSNFSVMVVSPVNDAMRALGLGFQWHQEPSQQRTSEVGIVSMGRPDFNLQEDHQNERRGTNEGNMPWVIHEGRTGVTEEERRAVNLERWERPVRIDPNDPPADLETLYNGTRRKTSVRSALGQEWGYMEDDDHIVGFATSDSVLYMLLRHPMHKNTLFLSEDFLWMARGVTQRMVFLYGTLVLLNQVSPDGLLQAAAAAAMAAGLRKRQATALDIGISAGPSNSASNNSGPAFGTRFRSAGGRKRTSSGEEGADISAADHQVAKRSKLLSPSYLQLTRTLGDGHAGKVYEGRLLGRPVVIKATDTAHSPAGKRLLQNEAAVATTMAPLWGQVVPHLLASGYIGASVFGNVYEKVEGRPLSRKEHTKALAALRKVHDHGVLHGDVKEDNFIVTPKGKVFVIDFGLSRQGSSLAERQKEEKVLQELWK